LHEARTDEYNKALLQQISLQKKTCEQEIEWVKSSEALKIEKEKMEKNFIKENCDLRSNFIYATKYF
jgi:hypothetical protein